MKWHAALGWGAFAAILVAGCSGGGSSADPAVKDGEAPKSALTGEMGKGELEVVSFKGGYGIDFFEAAGQEFEAQNEGLKVKVTGDPRVWETLRPRFVGGTPPDVTWPGWGMDYWALIYDGQVAAWDEELDKPAFGETTGKWRDSFDPGLLKLGQYEGKTYMLPYHININGWWYNPKMFKDNGWEVPKTFSELTALNDKIKAKGIAPITFQGQYPYYMLFGTIYPWIISSGGIEAWNDCQALKPGAWKSDAVLQAAKNLEILVKRGDFQKGAIGMNHTDSQTEFLLGRAAMVPCGSWLYSEMLNVMPKDASLEFMRVPNLDGGKGDPTSIQVGIEPWIVPLKGKNTATGVEYYRYLTSPKKAKEFIEKKGTLMSIKGVEGAKYPPHLVAAAKIYEAASTKWSAEIKLWYPELGKVAEGAITGILEGKLTPEQFCEQMEKKAEQIRKDDNIKKHKVE